MWTAPGTPSPPSIRSTAAHKRTLALAASEHDFLVNETGQVQSTSTLTKRELDAVVVADPAQKASLPGKIQDADGATQQFVAISQSLLLNGTNLNADTQ